jgi:hypothetical protein
VLAAPGTVLFTIKATAVASGANRATVDVVETVFAPSATTADTAGDAKLMAKQCVGVTYKHSAYMVFNSTATLETGSPAWPKTSAGVLAVGGQANSGDWTGFEGECAAPIVNFPGTVHSVMIMDASASPDSRLGWAKYSDYGFDAAVDGPQSSIPAKQRIEFTTCSITLGPLAAADPLASTWVAQAAKHKLTNRGCLVGADY